MPDTLINKVWAAHCVTELGDQVALLQVDRHFIHDLVAGPAIRELSGRGLHVQTPDLTFAFADHSVSSAPARTPNQGASNGKFLSDMRRHCYRTGIRLFDVGHLEQGIVHVVAPEQGLSLPGLLIVCADSHTCTHGALGALAIAIGSTEVVHVLATQTIRQRKPKSMRISFHGRLGKGVTAKDLVLHTIGALGVEAGRGFAVEYAGDAISCLDMESRFTICNMSIELGAKIGLVAPDDTTYEYIAGRRFAPTGAELEQAIESWRELPSDDDASFDKEYSIDATTVAPQVTWGTSPEDVLPITGVIPDPDEMADVKRKERAARALDYMGLRPGAPIAGTPIDWVFIGSCTNSRIEDLRLAARVINGRRVATGVTAWVVPGSEAVKRQAEGEGLHRVFQSAGFEWRSAGCSMCGAASGEVVPPGQRSVSTTNRNFIGRQGPGARTHLVSPPMAAAAAITGQICDVRMFAD